MSFGPSVCLQRLPSIRVPCKRSAFCIGQVQINTVPAQAIPREAFLFELGAFIKERLLLYLTIKLTLLIHFCTSFFVSISYAICNSNDVRYEFDDNVLDSCDIDEELLSRRLVAQTDHVLWQFKTHTEGRDMLLTIRLLVLNLFYRLL